MVQLEFLTKELDAKLDAEQCKLDTRKNKISEVVAHASTLYRALKNESLFARNGYFHASHVSAERSSLEQLLNRAYGIDSTVAVIGTLSEELNAYKPSLRKQVLRVTHLARELSPTARKMTLSRFSKNNRGGAYRNLLALELYRRTNKSLLNIAVAVLIPSPAHREYAAIQLAQKPICRKIYTKAFDWLYEKQPTFGECNNEDIRRLRRMLATLNPRIKAIQQGWEK